MKIPPSSTGANLPSPKPGGREKGLTKRTVKGAAGGMLGADYEDTRRPDPFLARKQSAGEKRGGETSQQGKQPATAQPLIDRSTKVTDPSRVILADRDAQEGEVKKPKRKQKKRVDRLKLDDDAPDVLADGEEQERRRDDDEDVFSGGADRSRSAIDPRAHLFEEAPSVDPGDLSLTAPDEIRRALGTPVAYAKHVMILAEAFRRQTGATRQEAIGYLATMFVAAGDLRFGLSALKALGPATGILDVYPLEVVEQILDRYPGVLPKVGYGSFFRKPKEREPVLRTDTETPLRLEYPPELLVRGFALRGGGQPGYVFEPAEEEGTYDLLIQTPGRYDVLVSAIARTGHMTIDRLDVAVRPAKGAAPLPANEDPYPERDAAKVAAWPTPPAPARGSLAPAAAPDDSPARQSSTLSAAHIMSRQTMGAIASDHAHDFPDDEE